MIQLVDSTYLEEKEKANIGKQEVMVQNTPKGLGIMNMMKRMREVVEKEREGIIGFLQVYLIMIK